MKISHIFTISSKKMLLFQYKLEWNKYDDHNNCCDLIWVFYGAKILPIRQYISN